jgi:hypothetical protein
MRHVLCGKCAKGKIAGTQLAFAAGSEGPAEYERVVFGLARQPTPDQRTISIGGGDTIADAYANTQPLALRPGVYNCDMCNREIHPGERICCYSAWLADHEIPPWEDDYLEREAA